MEANAVTGLVRQLLVYEAENLQDPPALIMAAERTCEKLRVHLSRRIGGEGFRTLITRALNLSTEPFPFLRSVRISADAHVEGLSEAAPTPEAGSEGAAAVLSQLFGLLITFIGEDLTRRMVQTVWPTFPLDQASGAESGKLTGTPAATEEIQ